MSFFDDYKTYTEPLEVPEIFHLWCAVSTLAAAAQRKVWLDMGLFKLAPNFYIVLNAPPGRCGKSTAMNLVRDILSDIPTVKIKSDSITKEKIYQAMEAGSQVAQLGPTKSLTHSSLTIFANEMSLLIKKGDRDFVSALNSLFDTMSMFRHSIKTGAENFIFNPFLNILGGTTPDWIVTNIQEDLLEGGLSARALIVHQSVPKSPNPFPETTPAGVKALERIKTTLEDIAGIVGQVSMTSAAKEHYASWYNSYYAKPERDPKMQGYHARKRVHLLKLAILCALSERRAITITPSDLMMAEALLQITEPCIRESLAGVGRNVLSPISREILSYILRVEKTDLRKLVEVFWHKCDVEELNKILEVLEIQGSVQLVRVVTGGKLSNVQITGVKEKAEL